MKRIRRTIALLFSAALVMLATTWTFAEAADGHTCLVLKTTMLSVVDAGASCVADAATTPPNHLCPHVTTTQITLIVCIERPVLRVSDPGARRAAAGLLSSPR